ncbi:hypothetical protein [Streptomyces sp. NBC_01669]|uniref:hypothetical protein n=1 Tax=Streptomyces sp. NBC_01669 TaxID=2975909 RepID=UPI0022530E0F|nr:hypothetical protein [Streptomyces sp. NBC_01669]MCX4531075.1 hypothetical protein [Streptomyces sp. NBC_01669]
MPDRSAPIQVLNRITADTLALQRVLRAPAPDHAAALATPIADAQELAGTAMRLFHDLAEHTPHPSPAELLLLERIAQIAKAAQDAGAELGAAVARAVENRRRRAEALTGRVVLIGPSPQQFIESATDLLDRIPALHHAIARDRRTPPSPLTGRPR